MADDIDDILAASGFGGQKTLPPSKIASYTPLTQTTGDKNKDRILDDAGRQHDVDPNLLFAQGFQESRFHSGAVSPKGAVGDAQFMPDTAREFGLRVDGNVDERRDPAKAIPKQAELMRKLLDRTGDVDLSLAGYNSGHNASIERLKRNRQNISETRDYVDRITKNYSAAQPRFGIDDILTESGFGAGRSPLKSNNNSSDIDDILSASGFHQPSAPNQTFPNGAPTASLAPATADIAPVNPVANLQAQKDDLAKSLAAAPTLDERKRIQDALKKLDSSIAIEQKNQPNSTFQQNQPLAPPVLPNAPAPAMNIAPDLLPGDAPQFNPQIPAAASQVTPQVTPQSTPQFRSINGKTVPIAQTAPTATPTAQTAQPSPSANAPVVAAKSDQEILDKATAGNFQINLAKKPKGMAAGDYLDREAIKQVAPKFGITNQEIDDFLAAHPDTTSYANLSDADIQKASKQVGGVWNVTVPVAYSAINEILNKRGGNPNGDVLHPEVQSAVAMDEHTSNDGLSNSLDKSAHFRQKDAAAAKDPLLTQAETEVYNSPLSGGTEAEVEKRYRELKDLELSDASKADASEFGRQLQSDTIGQSSVSNRLVGGVIGGLGSLATGLAGVGRGVSSAVSTVGDAIGVNTDFLNKAGILNWKDFSRLGQGAQIISNESSKNLGTAGDALNMAGRAVVDVPKLVGLTALSGGSGILAFASDALAQSAGRGESAEKIGTEAAKGAIMGALFHGASKLGESVENGLVDKFLPESGDITKVYKPKADIELVTKLAGNAARIGAIGAGTFSVAKAEGADNTDAFHQAAMMTLFDLAMSGEKFGKVQDLSNKVIRLWKDGDYSDFAFARQSAESPEVNVYDVTGKVPKEAVQAEIIAPDNRTDEQISKAKNVTPRKPIANLTDGTDAARTAETDPTPEIPASPEISPETTDVLDLKPTAAPTEKISDVPAVDSTPRKPARRPTAQGLNFGNSETAKPDKEVAPTKEEKPAEREFSSTQVNLPPKESSKVLSLGKKLIPDKDIFVEEGREETPHITVKFGLHTNDAAEVEKIIAGEKPFDVTLGKVSIFPGGKDVDYDVVKVDVDSPELHALNKKIAENTKVTDTHPEYKPHVTLAYVKKGEGAKYVGNDSLEGTKIPFSEVIFSGKDRNLTPIKLTGKDDAPAPPTISEQETPETIRQKGSFTKDGVTYTRSEPLSEKSAPVGKSGKVQFSGSEEDVPFDYRLMESGDVQPSHIAGNRNPNHFLPEAQPKVRSGLDRQKASDDIAKSPDLNKAGHSPNAYFGAPVVNERGEAIQGNNRSEAFKKHYSLGGTSYKSQLAEKAAEFGFTPEQVNRMKNPVLVRAVKSNDADAIRLGNYSAADLESGGRARLDPVALAARIPNQEKANIVGKVFNTDGDFTLNELIRDRQAPLLKTLEKHLTDSQRANMIDSRGALKPDAIKDLSELMRNFLLSGGDSNLPVIYDELPNIIQQGVLSSLPKIFGVPHEAVLTREIQNAILAFSSFKASEVGSFDVWMRQADMFDKAKAAPVDNFTPTEIALAHAFSEARTQREVKQIFSDYAGLVNKTPATMFDEARPGVSKSEAVKQLFGVNHNERKLPESTLGSDNEPVKTADEPAESDARGISRNDASIGESGGAAERPAGESVSSRKPDLEFGDSVVLRDGATAIFSKFVGGDKAEVISDGAYSTVPLKSLKTGESGGALLKHAEGVANENSGEINLKNLYNSDGDFNYETVKDVAGRVGSGELEITRLAPREEQGRIAGGRRNVEASIISGADARANRTESQGSGQTRQDRIEANRRVEAQLEKYAKHEGIWFDYDKFENDHTHLKNGEEAHVYKDQSGNFVLKAVDYAYFSPKYSPLEFLDERISLFNYLFPETKYELVGFTRDNDGRFRFILKQPYIDGRPATARQVSKLMKDKLGADSELTSEQFANREHHVSDLHKKNVLRDKNGNIFVIDPLIELTPERLGGERKYEEFGIQPAKNHANENSPKNDSILLKRAEGENTDNKPAFYSAVERAVENSPQNKFSADQIKAMLDPSKGGGVKKEELDWLGVDAFLDGKKSVTKDEMLDFIRENQVDVRELFKGDEKPTFYIDNGEGKILADGFATHEEAENQAKQIEKETGNDVFVNKNREGEQAKFSQYTLPGGENYKELLLTMPPKATKVEPLNELPQDYEISIDRSYPGTPFTVVPLEQRHGRPFSGRHATEDGARQSAVDLINSRNKDEQKSKDSANKYKSSHFDEPNILAHIRFDDRTDASGNKTLHIAEIQSDWHQEGRKKGYQVDDEKEKLEKEKQDLIEQLENLREQENFNPENTDYTALMDKFLDVKSRIFRFSDKADTSNKVPAAPFKKSWHELAFKKALRYASENGYDAVSWDTGEVQSDRYDLSKQIDRIVYRPSNARNGDSFAVQVYDKNSRKIQDAVLTASELENNFGKDIGEKIIAGSGEVMPNASFKTLRGLDLKVGGEGMKGFYDKILPSFVNKYVKKFGGRVEPNKIQTDDNNFALYRNGSKVESYPTKEAAQSFINRYPAINRKEFQILPVDKTGTEVHSVSITPAMRESVMQGQPLFRAEAEQSQKAFDEIKFAPALDLIDKATIERSGDRIKLNLEGQEILRRAIEESDIRVGRKKVGDAPEMSFSGLFVPTEITSATVATLKSVARENSGNSKISTFLNNFAGVMQAATRAGEGTAVAYMYDKRLPHEVFHQASYLGALGGDIRNRHARFDELKAHPAFQSAADYLSGFDEYRRIQKANPDYFEALVAEETGAYIKGGERELLGISLEDAANYMNLFYDSYVEKNAAKDAEGNITDEAARQVLSRFQKIEGEHDEQIQQVLAAHSAKQTERPSDRGNLSGKPDGKFAAETESDGNSSEIAGSENSGEPEPGRQRSDGQQSGISATGTKNETTDAERQKRGMSPAESTAKREFGTVWDEALKDVEKNRYAASDLVESLRDNPRPVSDKENALLLHRQIELQNAHNKATAEINRAGDAGEEVDPELQLEAARASDSLLELYNINKAVGTEIGRGLAARRMMAKEDFTLAQMETVRRAANNGKPLTEDQRAEIQKLHDRIAETQKAFDEHIARRDRALRNVRAQLARLKAERPAAVRNTPHSKILAELKLREADMLANIRAKFGDMSLKRVEGEQILAVTKTPEFKNWFGVSKVTDENGEPLIVYHGTEADFDTFDKTKLGSATMHPSANWGFVTTPNRKYAGDSYASRGGGNVMPLYVSVQNPYIMTAAEYREMMPHGRNGSAKAAWDFKKELDAKGENDGIILLDRHGKIAEVFAFESNQIKSAIGNNGEFSSANDSILKRAEPDAPDSDLVDWSTMTLLENLPKGTMSVGDFKNKLNELTGGKLSDAEISDIHAAAIENIRQSKPSGNEVNPEIARNRAAHYREADKHTADNSPDDSTDAPPKLDEEGQRLRAENERAKQEFQLQVAKDRLNNRTRFEKTADTFLKWRRGFVLSSPVTLAKLTAAAIERIGFAPVEDALGAGVGALIPGVAKRAPREGGLNVRAEAKALSEGMTAGMSDAWQTLKTGSSNLDVLYGKQHSEPRALIDFFGSIHGALKAPVKRSEFARSVEKRLSKAIANGVDATDPLVQTSIALDAYKDAKRSIFMQDNRVVSAYQKFLSGLEEPDKITGKTPIAGKVATTIARTLLPVVKIPVNIVGETITYATGTVTGSYKLGRAFAKGTENLTPDEADLIMRHLKKGLLGAAVMLLGFFLPDHFGGYYQPGEKRDETDAKFGSLKLFGLNVPSFLIHNPLLESAQIGATVRRVMDSKLHKKDAEAQGVTAGVMAGAVGVAEQVPFVQEIKNIAKLFDAKERGQFTGELAKSIAVPQGVQWIAGQMDKNDKGEVVKRKPDGVLQSIESGIPVLRNKIAEKPQGKVSSNPVVALPGAVHNGALSKEDAAAQIKQNLASGLITYAQAVAARKELNESKAETDARKLKLSEFDAAIKIASPEDESTLERVRDEKQAAFDKKQQLDRNRAAVENLVDRGRKGENVSGELKNLAPKDRVLVNKGISAPSEAAFALESSHTPEEAIAAFESASDAEKIQMIPLLRGKRFRSKTSESKAKYDAVLNRYRK